jgi:hypothetical protein
MQKRIKQVRAVKVREFILMNPSVDAKTIADKFHTELQTVYNIRYHLKKKLAEKGQVLERAENSSATPTPDVQSKPIKRIEQLLNEWNPPKIPETPAITFVQPDPINHPAHYTHGGIETIDFIQAKLTPEEFRGYLKGNILKYGSRIGHKENDMQDAGKLAWYTNKLRIALGTK